MEDFVQPQKSKPSTFLTVLCVLTFVGSGWRVLTNLYHWATFSPSEIALLIQQVSDAGDFGFGFLNSFLFPTVDRMMVTAEHGQSMYLLGFLTSFLSLAGAYLMFKLNRSGFILYVIAQLGMLLIMPAFARFSMVVVNTMYVPSFFTLLFITLYAINLKQMKKTTPKV